ncbi:MAG: hypothetical protein WAV13_01505 [Thermodesulfovibrionales bacterium]
MDFTLIDVDIEKDLAARDFAINALVWSPKSRLKENLISDPVRIIRAYRISGETSLAINENIQRILKDIGYKIKQAKTERVTLEFFRILNLYDPFVPLKAMLGHAILTHIICLSNSKLMAKLKGINHLNKIICERSFKNLLKLNNIFLKIFHLKDF